MTNEVQLYEDDENTEWNDCEHNTIIEKYREFENEHTFVEGVKCEDCGRTGAKIYRKVKEEWFEKSSGDNHSKMFDTVKITRTGNYRFVIYQEITDESEFYHWRIESTYDDKDIAGGDEYHTQGGAEQAMFKWLVEGHESLSIN